MKTEKIERRMRKRTVVYARDRYDVIIGAITRLDGDNLPLGVEGLATDTEHDVDSFSWFTTSDVRKATDDERAAFFAWLVSDGTDIDDGFARFGGAPRGFEEWRAAQTPKYSIDSAGCEFVLPEPVESPAPTHKRGDLRVWLRRDGTAGVARVTSVDDDGDVWTNEGYNRPDQVCEPTRENVAMLVAQQRERGIAPEVGDLVYVARDHVHYPHQIGIVSWCLEEREIRITSVEAGGDGETCCYYPHLREDVAVLVIRRNPLRELGDE